MLFGFVLKCRSIYSFYTVVFCVVCCGACFFRTCSQITAWNSYGFNPTEAAAVLVASVMSAYLAAVKLLMRLGSLKNALRWCRSIVTKSAAVSPWFMFWKKAYVFRAVSLLIPGRAVLGFPVLPVYSPFFISRGLYWIGLFLSVAIALYLLPSYVETITFSGLLPVLCAAIMAAACCLFSSHSTDGDKILIILAAVSVVVLCSMASAAAYLCACLYQLIPAVFSSGVAWLNSFIILLMPVRI